MPNFNEQSVVEDYLIERLQTIGWTIVKAEELERTSLEEPLLVNNLIKQLKKINSLDLSDGDINTILNELRYKPSSQEGAKQTLFLLKHGISIKLEKEKVLEKISLFDYKNIGNNEFIATRQAYYTKGDKRIRTDIILYVNGIPLVDIECKNPASFSESWFDAYKQIKEYEQFIPELYKYVQIGIAAEQAVRYFPIVSWADSARTEEWKNGTKDPIDAILEMLTPNVLLDIIQNFLFFRIERSEATKVITRYMQYKAVNKIVERVINNLQGKETKNKGLIWHWQGSGKTLEMIFAANKLYHLQELENPTIMFIVDRTELEEQLYNELNALDITIPEKIESVSHLRSILKHDEGKGKRGIMLTLIHKFRTEELSALQKELEAQNETILTRKNVIAFIDEGHRTQYGTLASQMKSLLKNAFFFAFTGTPISKQGKNTYLEFSYPPEETYLDKYFIIESINDGFTVKIAYQPRLEKEIHLKKEMLDAFLEIEEEEIPEDIKEIIKEKTKERINLARAYLENESIIKTKAEDIAKHFKENVEGKFKAMVVAVNRASCVRYKRELDKLLPKEYSEVVMTSTRKDPQVINDYIKELTDRNKGKELEEIRKEIVDNFKETENPKILIVTDMLLTGFDAPMLQTLYLDKPLKGHRLLQAIARTNRPYKDVKEAGLIIDYIGILKEFKRAFEFYSKEDQTGVLYNMQQICDEFVEILQKIMPLFKGIPKDQYDRKTLLQAIEVLTANEENAKLFLNNYKALRKKFELIGSDIFKTKVFADFQWLTAIYTYYSRVVLRTDPFERGHLERFFNKTIKYIHKTTDLKKLEEELPIIQFDADYFKKLDEKVKNRDEKAANIVFTLNRFILVDRHKNPIAETLSGKVQRLLDLWKEKTKDFKKIYEYGAEIVKEYNIFKQRQKNLGISDMEYSMLLTLEQELKLKEETSVNDVKELYALLKEELFEGWRSQPTAKKNVEKIIRKFIRKYIKSNSLSLQHLDALCQKLMERVENYGK